MTQGWHNPKFIFDAGAILKCTEWPRSHSTGQYTIKYETLQMSLLLTEFTKTARNDILRVQRTTHVAITPNTNGLAFSV